MPGSGQSPRPNLLAATTYCGNLKLEGDLHAFLDFKVVGTTECRQQLQVIGPSSDNPLLAVAGMNRLSLSHVAGRVSGTGAGRAASR